MVKETKNVTPLVYSCSGCSSAAQMTNYLATQLDRKGLAEMSCIAGVGGNVKNIVRTAKSGRSIIAIDGCALACSKACLLSHAIHPTMHIELSSFGITKKFHEDFNPAEAKGILELLEQNISKRELIPLHSECRTDQPITEKQLAMAGIRIEAVCTKTQLHRFVDFPRRLYRNNPFFVPQLQKDILAGFDKNINPVFDFCEARYWLAYKNGKIAGRIAGIINHSFIKTWGRAYVRFGWFDFEKDELVCKALLNEVEQWARQKGMIAVHGPLGFTNFDYAGMLTDGFHETGTFATLYNHPYYPVFMKKAGYKKEAGWVEYKLKVPVSVPEKLVRAASVVERRYHLRALCPSGKRELLVYAEKIFSLINESYAGLFGMVPMTEKQIQYSIRKYLSFVKPRYVSLVLDKNNELAAFGIAMPSLSKALQKAKGKLYPLGFLQLWQAFRKNKLADLLLVAVRKDMQGRGLNAILMRDITDVFIRDGVEYAESNPELEENNKVQSLWEYYEAKLHKRRTCFIKYIENEK